MRALILALPLLIACQPVEGPSGPAGPPGPMGSMGAMGTPGLNGAGGLERSGSRIKLQVAVFTTEDGALMERGQPYSSTIDGDPPGIRGRGFWDSKLEVPCLIAHAEDGALRCLPFEVSDGSTTGYADGSCTRVVVGLMAGTSRKYWTARKTGAKGYTVYSMGAKVAAPAKLYQKGSEGCAADPALPPGLDWYEAQGNPVAATEFVAAAAKTLVQ